MTPARRSAWSYMQIPAGLAVAAVAAATFFGGATLAITVALLIVLEICLSFDNAVVNAHVLEHWDEKWRKLFLGIGIIVAVFGVRLILPVVIVQVTTGMGFIETFRVAVDDPAEYGRRLHEVHYLISSFGGAFLAMVGLSFFFDVSKDTHWIGPIEKLLAKVGQVEAVHAAITLGIVAWMSTYLPDLQHQVGFIFAGLMGVILFIGSKALGTIATGGQDVGDKIIKQGIGGFLYLELLDASFSLDGVVGAFALTTQLPWIMVGLGVGALAVRELTVMAVDRGTLTEYPFLASGAFWAILALAGIMLVSPVIAIPEYVTGLVGAVFIGAAFISSLIENKRLAREA